MRHFGKEPKDKSVRAFPLGPKADNIILIGELNIGLKSPTLTSLVRDFSSGKYFPCPGPNLVAKAAFGRPLPPPNVMEVIEALEELDPDDIHRYRYIFSDLLKLPPPPPKVCKPGEDFAVKLIKFDQDKKRAVLREVAWIKVTDEVRSLRHFGLKDSHNILDNVPSVVKQGVTKEEAEEIIAKLNNAGGDAVMVPMESISVE